MNQIKSTLDIIGYASTIILILGLILTGVAVVKGVLPAIIRLGIGLSRRKIVVLATVDQGNSLKQLLTDSGLFQKENIEIVTSEDDLGKLENTNSVLLYWKDWEANIEKVLEKKKDHCSLIIYAPSKDGRIPDEKYEILDKYRNVIVTNFRGRLLNDIVNSMITSGYVR